MSTALIVKVDREMFSYMEEFQVIWRGSNLSRDRVMHTPMEAKVLTEAAVISPLAKVVLTSTLGSVPMSLSQLLQDWRGQHEQYGN